MNSEMSSTPHRVHSCTHDRDGSSHRLGYRCHRSSARL